MKFNVFIGAAALTLTGTASVAYAQSVPTVLIDGSSTVFPISEAVAEEFQKDQKGKTRVTVGVSGTGGGFKKFCRGELDITGASRPIKKSEMRSEEHTSELQSLMRLSYAVFCLNKTKHNQLMNIT